jgi:hypothetical protein
MKLPSRDAQYLTDRGYAWDLTPDPNGGGFLVVSKFDVGGGGFTPQVTDLMVRIPPQYPMTPLDMWYCHPPIRLAATGQFAAASDVQEAHAGRTWQRFSRHLSNTWRPGVDNIRSFFVLIQRELQGRAR